jgi:tight adherence protein B
VVVVIAVMLGAALWRPGPVLPVVIVLAAVNHPVHALIAAVLWAVLAHGRRAGGPDPDDEAAALHRIVSELEGGASPRAALRAAARSSGPVDLRHAARLVEAGMPARRIAASVGEALPHNGRLAAAAWALAGEAGAPAGPVMAALARRASERGRLDRERRASTAQARATAWLIAGLPLAVLVVLIASGRLGFGPALPIVLTGVALQAAGLTVVATMLRRAS